MSKDIDAIDAKLYDEFLKGREIFGFTFDELHNLRRVMNTNDCENIDELLEKSAELPNIIMDEVTKSGSCWLLTEIRHGELHTQVISKEDVVLK